MGGEPGAALQLDILTHVHGVAGERPGWSKAKPRDRKAQRKFTATGLADFTPQARVGAKSNVRAPIHGAWLWGTIHPRALLGYRRRLRWSRGADGTPQRQSSGGAGSERDAKAFERAVAPQRMIHTRG